VVSRADTGADVVRLGSPAVGEEELAEIREVLASGQLTMGPKVEEFESLLADAVGVEHAVAVSSGTAGSCAGVVGVGGAGATVAGGDVGRGAGVALCGGRASAGNRSSQPG